MLLITIDGIKTLVSGTSYKTIFQVCQLLGKNFPHFCYNSRLAIAGNCRICLVEVQGLPKPLVACATPITDNMVIFTKSPLVLKAREGVMEGLLLNHPLDCPVCDQGGECDLQELTLTEGREVSRGFIEKRSVSDKVLFSLIETKMTRCIHCTKCVRLSFVLGLSTMGMGGRGNASEIFSYGSRPVLPLVGNLVDICPVGWTSN